jgi:hypothetical protein
MSKNSGSSEKVKSRMLLSNTSIGLTPSSTELPIRSFLNQPPNNPDDMIEVFHDRGSSIMRVSEVKDKEVQYRPIFDD